METELLTSKEYYLLGIDIYKVLSLSIENRNMDIKAYLEETFSNYQKLIEKSCVISKKIVDKLTPLQETPEMPTSLPSEQTSYDEPINI